jgi:PAS domain S-box-containing protein
MARSGRERQRSSRPRAAVSNHPPFRTLVEDSDEGMILADGVGTILYANPAAGCLLGQQPTELVGQLGFELCSADHLPRAYAAFTRCLAEPGATVSLEIEVNHGAGTVRPLLVRLVNRLSEREAAAIVVYFRAADQERREQEEEHYRAVFEAAPIGLGVADLDGRLLVFNSAMLEPGGYTREDILAIGNVARLYARAEDRERVLAVARRDGFVWRHEVQFRAKSGACYDTLLSLAPVQFGGRRCWLATVEDVTKRKRAEERQRQLEGQLQQAQKMEAVGQMTAGVAHDFNNILSVIIGSADALAGATADDPRPEELAELRRAAERGAAMVQKLLGYSRHAVLTVTPTDFAALLRGLPGMLRHLVPEELTVDIQCAPGSTALADAWAVEQMVLNLVTNARDAMGGRGVLRIDVRPLAFGVADAPAPWMAPGAYVRLSVIDTGIGMDEATRARIFEPFFTTKPSKTGTGLGLAMVFGLVKQQRGYVDVASAPGEGTTVSLYFPQPAARGSEGGATGG